MNIWHDIDERRITPDKFTAIIEIPKGCKNKYELDKETGLLKLDRVLYTSTRYPANYGFIPRTYADDKDPLDVLVLCQEEIAPLTLVECYPIGMINMIDDNESDEKIIAIPFRDPSMSIYKNLTELPPHVFDEISNFFEVYKILENKKTAIKEIQGREEAMECIKACMENYKEKFGKKEDKCYSNL